MAFEEVKKIVARFLAALIALLHRAKSGVQALWYKGGRVECPICGARYREFLPFGQPERRNARCYRCKSLERHRHLYLYMKRRTALLERPTQMLHFAPEVCLDRPLRAAAELRRVTTNVQDDRVDVYSDISRLPFRSGVFDAVICSHVMEHVQDDRGAMRELCRVVKEDGIVLVQVPLSGALETYENASITSPAARRLHFGQEDHVRFYGEDLKDRLTGAGFHVEIHNTAEYSHRYGLKEDRIYVCRPSPISPSKNGFSFHDHSD